MQVGSGVGLMVVALGAGFDGRLAGATSAASLATLRFGFLVLGGCLLGASQVGRRPFKSDRFGPQAAPPNRIDFDRTAQRT